MIRRRDEEHLHFATAQGRARYSFNAGDFYEIHTAWITSGRDHCGIVLTQQRRYSTGEQVRRLLRLIGSLVVRIHEEPCGVFRPVVIAIRAGERTVGNTWRRYCQVDYFEWATNRSGITKAGGPEQGCHARLR